MKYTIEGFSQSKAIEFNLDAIDLCILRWITDFANTDSMVKMQVENKVYFWIKYEGLLQELPIIGIKKDSLYRRLKNMVEQGVLEHTTVKMGGTFSMYRFGKKFTELLTEKERVGGTEINPIGYGNKSVGGTEINPDQNNNLLKEKKSTKKESVEQSSTIPYNEIISYLNTKAGTNFRSTSNDNQKHIRARWNDGFRLEDFYKVIDVKVSEWKNDKKMAPFLRPSTLFGTKFEGYLQQANIYQNNHKNEAVSIPVSKEDKAKNPDGSYVVY